MLDPRLVLAEFNVNVLKAFGRSRSGAGARRRIDVDPRVAMLRADSFRMASELRSQILSGFPSGTLCELSKPPRRATFPMVMRDTYFSRFVKRASTHAGGCAAACAAAIR